MLDYGRNTLEAKALRLGCLGAGDVPTPWEIHGPSSALLGP